MKLLLGNLFARSHLDWNIQQSFDEFANLLFRFFLDEFLFGLLHDIQLSEMKSGEISRNGENYLPPKTFNPTGNRRFRQAITRLAACLSFFT